MWLLELLFFAVTLMIGWTLFGYFLFICFLGLFREKKEPEFPENWPKLSLIVPCYNEAEIIKEKLENIRNIDYPIDRLEVVFADGGSADDTVNILTGSIKETEPYRVVVCPDKGKIQQLNHVLPTLHGEIIVNTDVDSIINRDALKWLVAEFTSNANVWVVGAYCYPKDALKVEEYYWDAQNRIRFLESKAETSSIVIAQCYAFRKELLEAFPEDVIADDIYVAFLANTKHYKTVYSRHAIAVETRTTKSYSEFIPHKFRKSNAFLRESLRFLYMLPEMDSFCKILLLTRIAQQLILPWICLLWLLVLGILVTLFRVDIVIFGIGFLVVLLLLTNRVFAWVKLPEDKRTYSIITVIKGFLLTNMILLATGSSYMFFKQGSSYSRLGGSGKNAD